MDMTISTSSDPLTASELTQKTMLDDLLQQRTLLIGAAVAVIAFLFIRTRGQAPEEQAARRLVRDWRHVDDADDARDLLGSNVPTIVRPALLALVAAIEDQVHLGFRRLEREIRRL